MFQTFITGSGLSRQKGRMLRNKYLTGENVVLFFTVSLSFNSDTEKIYFD